MAKTAYLFDRLYMEHDTGWGHPEKPERLEAIDKKIRKAGFYNDLIMVKPKIAEYSYIEKIHDISYIDRVKREIEKGTQYLDSMDTVVCDRSFETALYAVGGCLNMCDTVMRDEAKCGFCAVRPPGHHAEKDYAAGFCIFNNIAIAARYLQSNYDIKRVAIIDWDVHHGNGTQHSFEKDSSIYYISLHQFPHYPGTGSEHEEGKGNGKGYTLNFPMSAGRGDDDYLKIFDKQIIPGLDSFKPEIVLISAGFDAHRSDPLSSIGLSTGTYFQLALRLKEVAKRHSEGRVIAFLEGGYNLNALAESVGEVIRAFIED